MITWEGDLQFLGTNIERARCAFFSDGRLEPGVNDALVSSWKRCLAFGHKPDKKALLVRQPKPAFEYRKSTNESLLKAARNELDAAIQLFGGLEFGIMLTDMDGVVLETRLNRAPYLLKFMQPGLDLSERWVGTSAMALAIDTGRSIEVTGPEHLFSNIQHLTCYAQPVFDTNGDLVGVLNIATTKVMPKQTARHILVEIADAISVNLVKSLSEYFVRFGYGGRTNADDGAIAFGPDGEVLGANKVAIDMLGLSMHRDPELLFSDLFDARFSDLMSGNFKSRKLLAARSASTPYFVVREVSRQRGAKMAGGASAVWLGDKDLETNLQDAVLSLTSRRPVFLQGPSGTGKTHAARWLHRQTCGAGNGLVVVNNATSQTGDLSKRIDAWRSEPRVGAVLIRDVERIALKDQALLAEFLDQRPQISVVCSSCEIGDGPEASGLIPALYYLLRAGRVYVPALSERDDKTGVIEKLIVQKLPNRSLTTAARNALYSYSWPGNFRELVACLDRVAVLCPDGTSVSLDCVIPMLEDSAVPKVPIKLNVTEAQAIRQALDYCNGNRSATARRLGISRATLHRRLKAAGQTGR